jgi:hypothetical protein
LIGLSSKLLAAILAYFKIRFNIEELSDGCWMTFQYSCVVEPLPELDNGTSSGTFAAAAFVGWLKLAFGLDNLCRCD